MDLPDAYRMLELAAGATEEAVRDARKTLAKVWHPDRHANDPGLQKKAEQKLADINTAFETIRAARFPPAPTPKPEPAATPSPPKPAEHAAKPAPKYDPIPKPAAKPVTYDDLVPRRRVRVWVILLVVAAIGVAAYFAIVKLGTQSTTVPPPRDATVIVIPRVFDSDAAEPEPPADATVIDEPPPEPTLTDAITIGSTREQVRKIQGEPKRIFTVITEDWSYGFSEIEIDPTTGRVVAWQQRDVKLAVKLVPKDAAVAAKAKATGTFTVGSSKDEVIALHGTPASIDHVVHETWTYGRASRIDFDDAGKVLEWSEFDTPLKARK